MAVYTIDVLTSGIEQGSISSSGNISDSSRVRSTGYLPFLGTEDGKVQMSATATTGKTIQVDLLGYTSNTTTSPSFDLYWYDSPNEFDISSYSNIKYLRMVLKYADGSTLIPSEVASCIMTYEYVYPWEMEGDYPVPTKSLPVPDSRFTKPYPASLWRIDGSNDGIPYNDLMPDVVYVFPEIHLPNPPEINTGQTTVIDDESSIEYVRYQVGYTNLNLYRFRDGELPEGVKCEVSIRGTNSYRYTEIPDYEDGSTTCEIP